MHSDQIPKVMEEPAKSSFNWGLNLLLSIILAGLLGAILPGVYLHFRPLPPDTPCLQTNNCSLVTFQEDLIWGVLIFGLISIPLSLLLGSPLIVLLLKWWHEVRQRKRLNRVNKRTDTNLGVRQRLLNQLGRLPKIIYFIFCALLVMLIIFHHGKDSLSSSVVGYNHTDKDIGSFTLRIGESTSSGGFLLEHHSGGEACCIAIPNPWQPGLTATVGWTDNYAENYQEREIPISQYDTKQVGHVAVHFLRNGEIKMFATMFILGHPDYPLKGPEAGLYPGEDPVEVFQYGRMRSNGHPPSLQDTVIAQLFRVIPDELKKLDRRQLDDFVAQHLKDSQAYGLIDVDDHVQYLILALYTSGKFREHPLVEARLKVPQSQQTTPFADWVIHLPEEVWATGKPLWESDARPKKVNEQGKPKTTSALPQGKQN